MNRVSFELLERSAPNFYDELMRELRIAYAVATDKALIAAFTASGTQATGVAATAAGLQSYVAKEAPAAYKATGKWARNLVASTDQWSAILGYADSTGRALFNAEQPYNAQGSASVNSAMGRVLGLDLYVDHNITVSGIVDESAFIVAPDAVTFYESPKTELRVNVLTSGEVELNLYGFYGIGVKQGAGIRRFNLV